MGYELKRLMGQFGVSTPGMVNYSGAAAPGKAPDAGATQADRDAFDESVRKYNLDNKSYDIYKKEYENRLQNSPGMYSQPQFNTASNAPSTAYSYSPMAQRVNAPGGGGIDQANRDIQNWFAGNPGATPSERAAIQQKYGVSDRDIRNAMGTEFNPDRGMVTQVMPQPRTPLTAPTYGSVSPQMLNWSAADKQNYYNSQRDIGYTANDLRKAAVNALGQTVNNQSDWDTRETIYNPNYVPTVATTGNVNTGNVNTGNVNTGLTSGSSAQDIANTYRQYTDSTGGDTAANQTLARDYLTNLGVSNDTMGAAYQKYLNPSANTGTIADLTPVNDFGFSPENPEFYYAHGGAVKTHYQTAGQVVLPGGYVEEEDTMPPAAVMPPAVTAAPNNRMADLQTMLEAYAPGESTYADELKTSRERAQQESDAFATMLSGAMSSPESDSSSKAELYFRLASAFGAPTKTGQFSENLGMVGQEMSEYAKDKRASSRDKLNLALKAQELKMGAAKEDLSTLRSLAAEEMRDKRAIGTEMIKEYVASGKPQSNAGQQARDEGLQMGTPEFAARVQELSQIDIDRKVALMTTGLENLSLRQQTLNMQEDRMNRLSSAEQNMKLETENTLNQTNQALENIKLAYALNPNTYDSSFLDSAQRKLGEISGSKDTKLLNTIEMENLLEKAALASLKATFPGAISDGERTALLATQGLGAKSVEARSEILRNAYLALQSIAAKAQTRLGEITSGAYRMTDPVLTPAPIDGEVQ